MLRQVVALEAVFARELQRVRRVRVGQLDVIGWVALDVA